MIRQTKQRQAILEVIERSHDHPTAAQVYERVRRVAPRVGYATIYRNLSALAKEGALLEIRVGDATQYDRRTDRHDHARCGSCGKVADVEVPLAPEVVEAAIEPNGFAMTGYHLEITGLCADCR